MGTKHIFLILGFIFSLSSCGPLKNPPERNKLKFNDPIDNVLDSLNAINEILTNSINSYLVYAIDYDDNLYISTRIGDMNKIGSLSDSLLFKNDFIAQLQFNEPKSFISLVAYLYNNYITRCDKNDSQTLFSYKNRIYMADRQDDLLRYLMLIDSNSIFNKYKILDCYKNLYLLANENAKIWETK